MFLAARASVANSGQIVIAGKSSSLSFTLSMVLVAGSSSQFLINDVKAMGLATC